MRISAKADYAVRAVLEIARAPECRAVTAENIACAQAIPRNFLLVILAELRRAGLVRSRRGQAGGWALRRTSGDISIADVIRAVDGPLASVQGARPEEVRYIDDTALLQQVWIALRANLRDVLETVTIADLAAQMLPDTVKELAAHEEAWQPH